MEDWIYHNNCLPTEEDCYLGLKCQYQYRRKKKTKPPKGYEPFYINYIGRHGSRYFKGEKELEWLISFIEEAQERKQLTKKGISLLGHLSRIKRLQQEQYNVLTAYGERPIRQMAERLWKENPTAFSKQIIAICAFDQSSQQSMEAFLYGLREHIPSQQILSIKNKRIDPILRFYELNREYLSYRKNGSWKEHVDFYEKREDIASRFINRFFQKNDYSDRECACFARYLYKLYPSCLDRLEFWGIKSFFKPMELQYFWENENLKLYLLYAASIKEKQPLYQIAFPLLENFLTTSEHAIRSNQISANFRFCHAEALLPFGRLLQIQAFSNYAQKCYEVSRMYRGGQLTPLNGNIKWIFYRSPIEQDILVKMEWNEEEVLFPFESHKKPYALWKEVKQYYEQQLKKLNIPDEEDLIERVRKYTCES